MAVVIYLIQFIIRPRRIIHNHDITAGKVIADKLVIKRFGRIGFRLYGISFLIFTSPSKLRRRFTESQCQHTIYRRKHFGLHFIDFSRFRLSRQFPQTKAVLPQFQLYQKCNAGSIVGTICLIHHLTGYQTVLADNIGNSGELSAITQRVFKQPSNRLVVHTKAAGIDYSLQKKIGFLQLVIEKAICL